MIGAYYQAYNKPQCVDFVLDNFRKHYPNSDVVLVSDGGHDFSELATKYNCIYFYEQNLSGDTSDKSKGLAASYFHSPEVLINYVLRFGKYISYINQNQFIILEDDVLVLNKTKELNHDINGSNPTESLSYSVCMDLKNVSKINYGACGGCILKTNFFKTILSEKNLNNIKEQIKRYCKLTNERWASDAILSYICLANNGSIGDWDGFGETWEKDIIPRLNNNEIEILHQYKNFY
jgi:hypothetical protein